MATRKVFYSLQEVFPQVDLRILKAVASQYSSDIDAAVEFVLSDVLPALSDPTEDHYTLPNMNYNENYERTMVEDGQRMDPSTNHQNILFNRTASSDSIDGDIVDKVVVAESSKGASVGTDSHSSANVQDNYELQELFSSCRSISLENCVYADKGGQLCSTSANETDLPSVLKTEITNNLDKSGDSYNLSCLFTPAASLSLPNNENVQLLCKSEEGFNLSELFAPAHVTAARTSDLCKSEDCYNLSQLFTPGHKDDASHVLCKSEDYNLSQLFAPAGSFYLMKAGGSKHDVDKLADDYNLPELFASAGSISVLKVEGTYDLSKSQDVYNLANLFYPSANLSIINSDDRHDLCKSEDAYNLSDLFSPAESVLLKAKCNKDENDTEDIYLAELFSQPRNMSVVNIREARDLSMSGDNFNLPELFASSGSFSFPVPDNALNTATKVVQSAIVENGEVASTNNLTVEDVANLSEPDDGYNLSDLFACTGSTLLSCEECRDASNQSSKDTKIELLKEQFSDVLKSKEEMASEYHSTLTIMAEVEAQEEIARQMKADMESADQDYRTMVQVLDQQIKDSRESNDKIACDVQNERSELNGLAEELESRLMEISSKKDETFMFIEELQLTLAARRTAALEYKKAAEEEIARKRNLARQVRKEKEAVIQEMIQESEKLQKEAEENALLREFLLERGLIVDKLQREIFDVFDRTTMLKEMVSQRNTFLDMSLLPVPPDPFEYVADKRVVSASVHGEPVPEEEAFSCNAADGGAASDDDWEILNSN